MQENSFSGCRYFVCFKDDFSKYRSVYFIKQKSDVVNKLKQFLAEVKTLGHTVKELLTDGGGEFDSSHVKAVTQQFGLNHRLTMPYTPEQNGAAERENRTLVEAARSMLQSKKLPNKLWAEAINTAAYVLNRTVPTKIDNKTPYEVWTGKQAPTDHLKIFGTECFVHVPKQKRQKLDAKVVRGHLVGYCGNTDGYRIYISDRDDVITSRDVIFKDELTSSSAEFQDSEGSPVDVTLDVEDNMSESNCDNASETVQSLRNRRQIKLPVRYEDYAMFSEYYEPKSHTNAMQSDNSDDWRLAMDDEIKSLAENSAWELVDKPDGKLIVDNRWVYKVKTKVDGSIDKFKARLVAKGCSQKAGIDYNETFSPVARFDSICE
jgi:hypothetical protein